MDILDRLRLNSASRLLDPATHHSGDRGNFSILSPFDALIAAPQHDSPAARHGPTFASPNALLAKRTSANDFFEIQQGVKTLPTMYAKAELSTALDPATHARARRRLIQMHFESGVGHLGGNLSCIDAMLLVFHEYLTPEDRFILSKGHSAGALYVCLWSLGRLNDADLQTFHKDDTRLPGHPPASGFDSIPFATGSLGHGLSLAAGTALAMRLKRNGGRVVCLTSDGEWQEGSTWEALIFLAHQKLANLTIMVDHNTLQGFGSTDEVASMNPLWERLRGFDVEVLVVDGHDLPSIRAALAGSASRPRIIVMRTVKAKGISFLEGRMDSHYLPLKEAQFQAAMLENPAP